jgi:hypothetical protein
MCFLGANPAVYLLRRSCAKLFEETFLCSIWEFCSQIFPFPLIYSPVHPFTYTYINIQRERDLNILLLASTETRCYQNLEEMKSSYYIQKDCVLGWNIEK